MANEKKKYNSINFFSFLNKVKIEYVVLGNINKIYSGEYGDIDIAMRENDYLKINELINQYCSEYNFALVQLLEHEICSTSFILSSIEYDKDMFLHIDVCSDYYQNSKMVIPADEFFNNTLLFNFDGINISVPSHYMSFRYYLSKKINKRKLDQSSLNYIKDCFINSKDQSTNYLNEIFGSSISKQIVGKILCSNSSMEEINKFYHFNGKFKLKSVMFKFLNISRIIKRIKKPTGMIVTVLGVDGSGKSTVIKELVDHMNAAFRNVRCYHLRPRLLSIKKEPSTPVANPHGQKPRGKFLSFIKLNYFILDYWLGYIFSIYQLKIRSTLVIFDRHFYDLEIDKYRYRLDAADWLIRFYSSLLPKPDLIFLCNAPRDIILNRKKEVTEVECERLLLKYNTKLTNKKNLCIIDTSVPVQKTREFVSTSLVNYLSSRIKSYS